MKALIGLALSALTLGVLLAQVGVGSIIANFEGLGIGVVALTVAAIWVNIGVGAVRYRQILTRIGDADYRYAWVAKLTFLTKFVSQFVPMSGVADIVRSGYVWKVANFSPRVAVESALYDRFIGFAFLLALTVLSIPLQTRIFGWGSFVQAELALAGVVAACLIVLWGLTLLNWPRGARWFNLLRPSLERGRLLVRADDAFLFAACSIVNVIMLGLGMWILSEGMGLDVPLPILLVLSPVVVLSQNIPFFFAGWGIRELTLIVALDGADLATQQEALALSLALGACYLVAALPGSLFWVFRAEMRK